MSRLLPQNDRITWRANFFGRTAGSGAGGGAGLSATGSASDSVPGATGGVPSGSSAPAVPEPASRALLVLGTVMMISRSSYHCKPKAIGFLTPKAFNPAAQGRRSSGAPWEPNDHPPNPIGVSHLPATEQQTLWNPVGVRTRLGIRFPRVRSPWRPTLGFGLQPLRGRDALTERRFLPRSTSLRCSTNCGELS